MSICTIRAVDRAITIIIRLSYYEMIHIEFRFTLSRIFFNSNPVKSRYNAFLVMCPTRFFKTTTDKNPKCFLFSRKF